MTAAYKRQEVGVLDAAALRPPPFIFYRRWRSDVARQRLPKLELKGG